MENKAIDEEKTNNILVNSIIEQLEKRLKEIEAEKELINKLMLIYSKKNIDGNLYEKK